MRNLLIIAALMVWCKANGQTAWVVSKGGLEYQRPSESHVYYKKYRHYDSLSTHYSNIASRQSNSYWNDAFYNQGKAHAYLEMWMYSNPIK